MENKTLLSPCCKVPLVIDNNSLTCPKCHRSVLLTVPKSREPNFQVDLQGDTMVLTLKANLQNPPLSSSGKSHIVFTTHGFVWHNGLGYNITICRTKR